VGLVKQAAVDHARDGVRVNLVLPGYVATPLALARLSEAELDERARRQPLGRLARPDEIADAVTWLSGDGASFITGSSLVVDGGYLAL
jgi:NAD(P)-dependent dehydrogenase (short-subunit alcohol dehydrogenase family)